MMVFPVVYDSVGKDTFIASLDALKPREMMVLYGPVRWAGSAV
ncbi:MAG: hypothetical protein U0165_11385 [Polyangiaceae bacterium]